MTNPLATECLMTAQPKTWTMWRARNGRSQESDSEQKMKTTKRGRLIHGGGKSAQEECGARTAFTLIELLVVIAIIAILVALLLPALSRAKGSVKSAVCRSNLKQIGIGLNLYVNEFENYPLALVWTNGPFLWTDTWVWRDILLPYCGSRTELFTCPSLKENGLSYGYNDVGTQGGNGMWGPGGETVDSLWDDAAGKRPLQLGLGLFARANVAVPASSVLAPSDMIGVLDSSFPYEWRGKDGFGWPGFTGWSHNGQRNNAVFCDGHVETSRNDLIPQETGKYGGLVFKPDETHAKRWNNDNQPHQETWP